MKKHKGILAQINDANNVYKPEKLTEESITKVMTELMEGPLFKNPSRQFVFYTGIRGYRIFDFTMKYGESFVGRWWITGGKHLDRNVLYLSVVRKHSVYKVKVIPNDGEYKFLLFKGTEMTDYYNNIKALNKKLFWLNKEADIEDAHRAYERSVKIAQRELEGKLQLIENRYE